MPSAAMRSRPSVAVVPPKESSLFFPSNPASLKATLEIVGYTIQRTAIGKVSTRHFEDPLQRDVLDLLRAFDGQDLIHQ